MAGYVCAFAGGKGGVGKTTTAVDLGAAFHAAGHDTVVVDADLGMADVAGLLGLDVEQSVHDVLAGEAAVDAALTDTETGLTVLPGADSLAAFAAADPGELGTVLGTLRERHDVVLVDTPAALSHEATVPLGLADGVVLVTTPDPVAVADAGKTADLATRVDGTVLAGLATRVTGASDPDDVERRLGTPLLGVVPEVTPTTAPMVVEAPDSDAATAYTLVAERLEDVFFEGADPSTLERVSDPAWFDTGRADDGTDSGPEGTGDGDTEEDGDGGGGRFGFAGLWTG
jgi:septum site-determining protein MinD